MKNIIKIGERKVGGANPVFIIAEVSCNHMGDYDTAVKIVRAAAEAGADAVKLQTYTADTMTIDCSSSNFKIKGNKNPDSWKDKNLYKLYEDAYTPWEWQPKLAAVAQELGLILFSSPFDDSAVDFLEKEVKPPCYKIASYELTDDRLLEKVARTGKPVIISNGYASLEELEHAVEVLKKNNTRGIIVLYCVTEYAGKPTSDNVNLSTMQDIQSRFGVVVGLSDNNGGVELPVLAVLNGASVIEKHLILDKNDQSYDKRFSLDPGELKKMVKLIREVQSLKITEKEDKLKELDGLKKWRGVPFYGPTSKLEKTNTHLRRSLVIVEDMKAGDSITSNNVRSIRPEIGLAPRYYREVIDKKINRDSKRGTPLSWDLIE